LYITLHTTNDSYRYYSFRLGGNIEGKLEEDARLSILKQEWFEGKKALDIGCNSGEFTIEIGMNDMFEYFLQ